MHISIRKLGSTVAAGLLCISIGGAITSAFVLNALTDFSNQWAAFTQNYKGDDIESLSQSVDLMHFLVLGGSIATISTLFAVGLFFMWFTNKKVVNPMVNLTKTMDQLANGNTDTDIPYIDAKDEIGVMAHAVGTMKENTIARLNLEARQKELEEKAKETQREEMGKIANAFEKEISSISQSVAEAAQKISSIGTDLGESVKSTKDRSTEVSSSADEASHNIQNISQAAQDLSSSIHDISVIVNETASTAKACAQEASSSKDQLDGLQSAVDEIDEVIKSINDIAEQTNLLALNATIEAARAGEAGKGFAVVASEVKNLANQTQSMTEDIKTKVDSIKSITSMSVQSMSNVISRIEHVDEQTESAALSVEKQNNATSDITVNIQNTAVGTQHVSDGIGSIMNIAEQSVSISNTLDETSHILLTGSEQLGNTLKKFLSELQQNAR